MGVVGGTSRALRLCASATLVAVVFSFASLPEEPEVETPKCQVINCYPPEPSNWLTEMNQPPLKDPRGCIAMRSDAPGFCYTPNFQQVPFTHGLPADRCQIPNQLFDIGRSDSFCTDGKCVYINMDQCFDEDSQSCGSCPQYLTDVPARDACFQSIRTDSTLCPTFSEGYTCTFDNHQQYVGGRCASDFEKCHDDGGCVRGERSCQALYLDKCRTGTTCGACNEFDGDLRDLKMLMSKLKYDVDLQEQCPTLLWCDVMDLDQDSVLCKTCPAGSYSVGEGVCHVVPDGNYADVLKTGSRQYQKCPRGTFSCSAYYTGDEEGCAQFPILNTSTCWFPDKSPLALKLSGAKLAPRYVHTGIEVSAAVTKQCKEPPMIFKALTPALSPPVWPSVPRSYLCDAGGTTSGDVLTTYFYKPPEDDEVERWVEICAETFFAEDNTDRGDLWLFFVQDEIECTGTDPDVCEDGLATAFRVLPLMVTLSLQRLSNLTLLAETQPSLAFQRLQSTRNMLSGWRDTLSSLSTASSDIDGYAYMMPAFNNLVDMYSQAAKALAYPVEGAGLRFVAPFNNDYYSTVLSQYVEQFSQLIGKIEQQTTSAQLLSEFNAAFSIQGTRLAGEEQVLKAQEEQLYHELSQSVLPGIQEAIKGQRRVEQKMEEVKEKLKDAVYTHMATSIFTAVFNLFSGLSALMTNPYGAIQTGEAALADAATDVPKWVSVAGNVLNFGLTVSATVTYSVISVNALTSGDFNCGDDSEQTSSLCGLINETNKMITLTRDGCTSCGHTTKESTNDDWDLAVAALRAQLSGLGEGYWAEHVADAGDAVDIFLSGGIGGDKAAGYAYEFRDYLKAQAAYGRDYVAQVSRYLELQEKLRIIGVQRNANIRTANVIKSAVDQTTELKVAEGWQLQVASMQVYSLAETMRITMELICQGLVYQSTEQYMRCTTAGDGNPFEQLCGSFEAGGPLAGVRMPMRALVLDISNELNLGAQISNYHEYVLKKIKYSAYGQVQVAVAAKMWSSSALNWVLLIARPYVPPTPNTTEPSPPYRNSMMPIDAATWDAFTNSSSPTHGELRVLINNETFGGITSDYSGMFVRGFLGYLHNTDSIDGVNRKLSLTLEPTAAMQQQYWSHEGSSIPTVVNFQAAPAAQSVYPVSQFEYMLQDVLPSGPQPCAFGSPTPVFTNTDLLCPSIRRHLDESSWETRDRCPDRVTTPRYCITSEIASGTGPAAYYATPPPQGAHWSQSPFNLPALLTQWKLKVVTSYGTANKLDLSNLEGVYLKIYFQSIADTPLSQQVVCQV